jgi:hypothetical protein
MYLYVERYMKQQGCNFMLSTHHSLERWGLSRRGMGTSGV